VKLSTERLLAYCLILALSATTAWATPNWKNQVDDAILGALVYLDDTQIRNRPGAQSCVIDASNVGEGSKGKILFTSIFKHTEFEFPAPFKMKVHNREGEWASFVHPLPGKHIAGGRSPIAAQDSSLFVPAFVSYPLLLVRDSEHPIIAPMLDLAMDNINDFKRGQAYDFWPCLPEGTAPLPGICGPINLPYGPTEKIGKAFIHPIFGKLFNVFGTEMANGLRPWLKACLDEEGNPYGITAVFNIPVDADDTSVAVATQLLYANYVGERATAPDLAALELVTTFRDLDRTKEDGRDAYKGKDSGAYLTWLRDETLPTFADPEAGVIPLDVNNVDAVVNANALFSLTLNGMTEFPGYEESARLLEKVIEIHAWPEAGLYYPQRQIFPYSVSRAWRDAGACREFLRPAMKRLLYDLLQEQILLSKPSRCGHGSFPGGEDSSTHLSTALALTALLNIGEGLAEEAGCLGDYRVAIEAAVGHLIGSRKSYEPRSEDTFTGPAGRPEGCKWDDGLFFSASFWDLAQWRSRPYAVAMVLEALIKYRMEYHKSECTLAEMPRLQLVAPSDEQGWSLVAEAP